MDRAERFTAGRTVMVALLAIAAASLQTTGCGRATQNATLETSAPRITVLDTYPNGSFLENLFVHRSDVYFTNYFAKTVHLRHNDEPARIFATLPIHPASVVKVGEHVIVAGHAAPFTSGPAFTQTNAVITMDADGNLLDRTLAPEALFLNGMTTLAQNKVLIADSMAGRIWLFEPDTRGITAWMQDEMLTPDPANPKTKVGANGIKTTQGAVYVSNSARGAVYRVDLDADLAPKGSLTLMGHTGSIDDFVVLPDGSVLVATHSDKILHMRGDGTVTVWLASGCDGCTALGIASLQPGRLDVLVTTTGKMLEGGKGPSHLLRISGPVD